MRVAVPVSGSATTLLKFLEREKENYQKYGYNIWEVAMVLTDNRVDSKAFEICEENSKLLVYQDLKAECRRWGDKNVRFNYDQRALKHMFAEGVDLVAHAGWEWYRMTPVWGSILSVNGHPCNLTKLDERGRRMFTGLHNKPIEKAILAGEKYLRTSIHVMNGEVDGGPVLTLSDRLEITLPEGFDPKDQTQLTREAKRLQGELKVIGDWVAYPFTLDAIALGDYTKDPKGNIYYKGEPCPVKLSGAA